MDFTPVKGGERSIKVRTVGGRPGEMGRWVHKVFLYVTKLQERQVRSEFQRDRRDEDAKGPKRDFKS